MLCIGGKGHGARWNPDAPETTFALELPAEVLAKKLFFRGWALTARDLFDWVCLRDLAPQYAIPHHTLAKLLRPKLAGLEASLCRLNSSNPAAALAWRNIRAAVPLDLDSAAQWARQELTRYANMRHP